MIIKRPCSESSIIQVVSDNTTVEKNMRRIKVISGNLSDDAVLQKKKGKGEQSGEIVCYFEQFDGDSTPAWANTWTCSRKRAVLLPRPSQMGMSVKLRIRGGSLSKVLSEKTGLISLNSTDRLSIHPSLRSQFLLVSTQSKACGGKNSF